MNLESNMLDRLTLTKDEGAVEMRKGNHRLLPLGQLNPTTQIGTFQNISKHVKSLLTLAIIKGVLCLNFGELPSSQPVRMQATEGEAQ